MNLADAAYHTVHDYPGGAEALGPRLGKLGTSLSGEVRVRPLHEQPADLRGVSRPKFGLLDALKVQQLTGDHRIFFAMAASLHYLPVPLPELHADAPPCASSVAQLAEEFAQLMQEVVRDIADSEVNDNELGRIQRCWGELVTAGQQLLLSLGDMNEKSKLRGRQGAR